MVSSPGSPDTPPGARLVPPQWLAGAPLTQGLIALNVAVFLVQCVLTRGVMDLPARPALALGASYALATVGEHRWETLVTACFLHGGITHLSFNMIALWQAGPLVERAVGPARMAPLYLVAGALGNAFSVAYGWFTGDGTFSVGASGAILGLISAAMVLGWRIQGWQGPLTQAMVRWLGLVVVFGLASGFTGGRIDNFAHIGGAVAGVLFAVAWRRGAPRSTEWSAAVVAGCAAVLAGCIAVVSLRDRSDPFATMTVDQRSQFTVTALHAGRCADAMSGLAAVERLQGIARRLRSEVGMFCPAVD